MARFFSSSVLAVAVVVGLLGPSTRALAEEDDDDGGRGIVWIRGDVGLAYVDLRSISYDNLFAEDAELADAIVQTSGTGPQFGGSAGFRLLFLTIGAHLQLASYDAFQVGTLMLEVEAHLPVPLPIEPYVRVGFGYAWVGQDLGGSDASVTVNGYDLRAGLGLDVFLHEHVSIGAAATIDVLNLSRQEFGDPVTMVSIEEGSAVGIQAGFMAQLGLHF